MGGFEERCQAGGSGADPPGSFRSRGSVWFPRGLPVRAEALAVRRSADPKTEVFGSRLRGPVAEARSRSGGSPPAEAGGPPDSPWAEARGLPLRSSQAEAWSCPTDRRPKPVVPPVAARRLSSPLLPDRFRAEAHPLPVWLLDPKILETLGTYRSLPLSHPLKGQARSFRMAAASSAARPLLGGPRCLVGQQGPLRSGCGWEGSRPSPVDRLGHGPEAVMETDSGQADSACG